MTTTKALLVERFFYEIAKIFGYPSRLSSDQRSAYTSKRFIQYSKSLGLKHVLTAVATPLANGQVEAYNRTSVVD